ncbi:uncharacterized protein si:ch73-6k14.2 [Kryptolebias marmoratus]|uniref:uncharacterized protein si:ch73-6k14.2 n=1 Tax=Kryptolebias marmoratus TaxID=37003 RepID=UPI0018AC99C0|nr:uncharacterized protein si:ch73-6k14.2 [Kryptolebias marmoratus]XP_037830550.1 uncharacterized protein si:ch73-6k14.2 [Kryptolebias marmoratus]
MKSRCLLSSVDRLPTIDEIREDGPPDRSSHTMEEYLDSIKELSQPSCYPLHGPLRGRRRWMPVSVFLTSPWLPVDPSDVSFSLTEQSSCDPSGRFKQNLVDMLLSPSLFAGLT